VIYGLEDRAIAMELVEGPTLKGPLPVETALNYAEQIAEALEAAHEKGITHRDLKPGNIMVTPAGVVKVLDFGLAAVASETPAEAGATVTLGATDAGVILGTAAYMAPEQARGQRVDKRADIWAFGVVLYEMLTGERLFQGKTTSDVLASVLTKEPDVKNVPLRVRPLLKRCLEKDPQRRLRDIGDAMSIIENTPERTEARGSRPAWAVAAALALALIVLSIWAPWRQTAVEERPVQFSNQPTAGSYFSPWRSRG